MSTNLHASPEDEVDGGGRQARQTRSTIHGFLNYPKGYEHNAKRLTVNSEP